MSATKQLERAGGGISADSQPRAVIDGGVSAAECATSEVENAFRAVGHEQVVGDDLPTAEVEGSAAHFAGFEFRRAGGICDAQTSTGVRHGSSRGRILPNNVAVGEGPRGRAVGLGNGAAAGIEESVGGQGIGRPVYLVGSVAGEAGG